MTLPSFFLLSGISYISKKVKSLFMRSQQSYAPDMKIDTRGRVQLRVPAEVSAHVSSFYETEC